MSGTSKEDRGGERARCTQLKKLCSAKGLCKRGRLRKTGKGVRTQGARLAPISIENKAKKGGGPAVSRPATARKKPMANKKDKANYAFAPRKEKIRSRMRHSCCTAQGRPANERCEKGIRARSQD